MLMNNHEYLDLVQLVKQEIRQAQYKATLSVNKELIMLYHSIGRIINEHKSWGNKFIDNLAADIKLAFPEAKGYSVRNLKYMAKFAATYGDVEFVQTVSAQIPWSHNTAILDKVKTPEQREWYIRKTAENGWSHSVLVHQIESGLYQRQAVADKISNFENRLPAPQSELAVQTMKDPYIFDFIPFKEDMVLVEKPDNAFHTLRESHSATITDSLIKRYPALFFVDQPVNSVAASPNQILEFLINNTRKIEFQNLTASFLCLSVLCVLRYTATMT